MLSDDLLAFLQSGVSLYMATRDRRLRPHGGKVWALVADADRTHVTVFAHKASTRQLLRNLEQCPEIAVVALRATDNMGWQIKGERTGVREAKAAERAEVHRQVDRFLNDLASIGIPRLLTSGWRWWPCVAVRLRVDAVFHQTPGPGAGEPAR